MGGALVTIAACALGCGAAPPAEGGTEDGSTGAVDLPSPDFIGPLDGALELPSTHATGVVLDIDAEPGITQLEIDERNVGTLGIGSSIGVLAQRTLTLFVRGGLVPGTHRLVMRTPDAVETEASDPVMITIVDAAAPALVWESGDALDSGEALVVGAGVEAAALGLVIVDGGATRVRAWPPGAAGWATDRPRDVAMPGYTHLDAGAAVALSRHVVDDVDRLRVAWRLGTPGDGIAITDVAWDGDDGGDVVVGFVPDASWLGAREWTEIGRPHLVGPLVLAEVLALVDSEQSHPGERTVAFARWSAAGLPIPQVLPIGAEDLDALAAVLDLRPEVEVSLGGRFAGVRPGRLEIGADGAVRVPPLRTNLDDPRWGDIDGPLVTSVSAFGSRIVAGLEPGRASVLVAWIDDSGDGSPVLRSVGLPDDTPATGALALARIGGAIAVLVPRGAADMVAIATSDGSAPPATMIGATCDSIVTPPRQDETIASVEVACLRDGALSFGLLRVQ